VGVKEGDTVKRTKRIASIKTGEGMVGRVVNTLGEPIDGKGPISGELFEMPIERKAPGVIYREPVKEPLQTGIKAIDAMIPVGRGQRELIIGDRQTGKSTVAIDTIINQKEFYRRRQAGVLHLCGHRPEGLHRGRNGEGAWRRPVPWPTPRWWPPTPATLLRCSSTRPSPVLPSASIFRDTGRPALIVYDDLSKQAVAYREVSLLLRRPPGREAYPGDVFYLHSRLLERAAKITADQTMAEPDERPARLPERQGERRWLVDRTADHRDPGR
jgi:F-type H+-transporting ATPase subunit alpha